MTTLGKVLGNLQPDTLNLSFDYLPLRKPKFVKGQIVARISLPSVVLKTDGTELAVCGAQGCPASLAELRIKADCTGGTSCLKGSVIGDFGNGKGVQPYAAADVGVKFALVFGPSPVSEDSHAIFGVQVKLVVTLANDPAYFAFNPIFNAFAFAADDLGSPAPVLGTGLSVGIPPYAAPLCPGGACDPKNPPPSTFPFCASFSRNSDDDEARAPIPAVAAFLHIGTDGEALVSTPLASSKTVKCAF